MNVDDFAVPTWTEPATLKFLSDLAAKSKFMVELGTYFGASSRPMLRASPGLHLWCVDTFEVFGSRHIAEMFLHEHIKSGRCEIIVGNSDRAAQMLQHMGGLLDAVFVDDGHQDWQVKADITNFYPLLKEGGVMVGHDWDGDNDVAQGVKAVFPMNRIDIPVPRLWRVFKQGDLPKGCCGKK
jgi:predicted O-methyltransferase YrrM